MKGQIVLGADSVDNRMNSLAVNEMVFGEYRPVERVIQEIDQVSVDSIQHFLDLYFQMDQMGLMLMGAMKDGEEMIHKLVY